MNKINRVLCLFLIVALLSILQIGHVFANAAEPPSLVIMVNEPVDVMTITMVSNDQLPEARYSTLAWEHYFVFRSSDMQDNDIYEFQVTTADDTFRCSYDKPLKRYNEVLTLDMATQTLTYGTYPLRTALLVSLRVSLTLAIEGIIFFIFGFRDKRSWLGFLYMNLVTQTALNFWLSSGDSLFESYIIISLIFGELFVFLTEIIGLPMLIDEKSKGVVRLYAFLANAASLILGGYLIAWLPV